MGKAQRKPAVGVVTSPEQIEGFTLEYAQGIATIRTELRTFETRESQHEAALADFQAFRKSVAAHVTKYWTMFSAQVPAGTAKRIDFVRHIDPSVPQVLDQYKNHRVYTLVGRLLNIDRLAKARAEQDAKRKVEGLEPATKLKSIVLPEPAQTRILRTMILMAADAGIDAWKVLTPVLTTYKGWDLKRVARLKDAVSRAQVIPGFGVDTPAAKKTA